jgi:hypothetical protein
MCINKVAVGYPLIKKTIKPLAAESFLRSQSRNLPQFIKPEISLPFSQK